LFIACYTLQLVLVPLNGSVGNICWQLQHLSFTSVILSYKICACKYKVRYFHRCTDFVTWDQRIKRMPCSSGLEARCLLLISICTCRPFSYARSSYCTSLLQSATSPWPVPVTTWWQRHMGVNKMPGVLLDSDLADRKFDTLPIMLPSLRKQVAKNCYLSWHLLMYCGDRTAGTWGMMADVDKLTSRFVVFANGHLPGILS